MTRVKDQTATLCTYLIVAMLVACLLWGKTTANAIRTGMTLCYSTILPALFPFFVLSDMLLKNSFIEYSRIVRAVSALLHVPIAGAFSFIVGIICGYPLGIKTLAASYQRGGLTTREASQMLLYVNNAGPAFLVGGIGIGLYGSAKIGWLLYFSEILSALLLAFIVRSKHKAKAELHISTTKTTANVSLISSITDAVQSMLGVCGMICFFSMISALILPLFPPFYRPFIASIIEMTDGIKRLTGIKMPFWLLFSATGAAVSFGGICVHAQAGVFLSDSGLSFVRYLIGKCLCATISFCLCFLFYLFKWV